MTDKKLEKKIEKKPESIDPKDSLSEEDLKQVTGGAVNYYLEIDHGGESSTDKTQK